MAIFEREIFPRDHVGESQLPLIGSILQELGVWERVEACGFPVKIGATYRWGNSNDLWDFNFLPNGHFEEETRPAQYKGQRTQTAFQVDRSVYDKILIDFAADQGCSVHFGAAIREVIKNGDRIECLILGDGSKVTAKYYVDASGHAGFIRRSMGIEIEEPALLRNIAVWDYWRNAEWAVSLGIGGTRIQVLSLGYGWIWFIPIGEDRTSIGFVCPAEYYKNSGLSAAQLYKTALDEEPRMKRLLKNAACENRLSTTKDWSYVASRMTGKNWFLVGEAMGFADPILSAGLTLTHTSAKELACLILEMERRGDFDWLCQEYGSRNERRIRQHIKFADYWYTANAHFSDLKEYTAEIAREAGLDLDAEQAFQWLGTGGFVDEDMEVAGLGLFRIDQVHQIGQRLSAAPPASLLDGYNLFILKIQNAEQVKIACFENGGVDPIYALKREGKLLPLSSWFGWIVEALRHSPQFDLMLEYIANSIRAQGNLFDDSMPFRICECLEAMIRGGWVKPKRMESIPVVKHSYPFESAFIRHNVEGQ